MAVDFELPGFNFFEEGNVWTGSRTKDREQGLLLRIRIAPDRENGKLQAAVWKEDVCFERAREKSFREFPFRAEALQEMQDWFGEEYKTL